MTNSKMKPLTMNQETNATATPQSNQADKAARERFLCSVPASAGIVALSLLVLLTITPRVTAQDPPARMLAVAWNDLNGGSGHVDLMNPEAPWDFAGSPLETGRFAVMRIRGDRIYVVCPEQDAIKTITREPWAIERTYNLATGTAPVDIAVADGDTAYVTGRNATHLLRLDLSSGTVTEVIDLSPFADSDGVPDLGDMAVFEGRLFLQIRRLNEHAPLGQVTPAYLAVMDLA